jgi:hypothetical protein
LLKMKQWDKALKDFELAYSLNSRKAISLIG